MVKGLQDLWILTETGVTLFSRVYDEKINDQFFGALMSALNKFAEQISEGGLSHFQLKDKRFSILKDRDLLFIANSNSAKISEKKALTELNSIADKFFKNFSDILENWDNDVSVFEGFEHEIEDSLEDVLKKFQNAFW